MKNKIFIGIILFLIFFIFGLLIYINNVFAPVTLKAKIIFELEKKLQANVQIENIRYNLFNGLILQNLSVYKEAPDRPYFSIKEITLNPLLLPLLQKKIIIPLVLVDSPKIYLEFDENKKPKLPELNPPAPAASKKQEFSLTILKIGISNGGIYLKDKSVTPNFIRELTAVKIGAELNLPQQIKFLLQAKISNPQNNPSFILAEGEYNPGSQKLAAQVKLNSFLAKEYLSYLKNLPFLLSEGTIDADLKVGVQEKLLNLTGSISSKATVVRSEKFAFSGDLTLKPQLEYGLQDQTAKYNAVVQIARGKFIGLKLTKEITDIQGDIQLNETRAQTSNLKAKIFDSPAKIKGSLENFTQPLVKLKISSQRLKLNTLATLLPDAAKNLTVEGQARTLVNLNYDANNPPLEIKGVAEIDSPKLKVAALKDPIEKVRGIVVFSRGRLTWPHIFFTHKNVSYETSGSVKDFTSPQLNCTLSSSELSFTSSLTLRDNQLNITSCAGKYRQSEFDIQGSVNTQTYALDLGGKVSLNLNNVFGLLTDQAREKLQKMKLGGSCKIEGTVKGNAKEPKNLQADLKVASGNFSIYDLKIDNAAFNLKQRNSTLSVSEFTAKSYDGTIDAQLDLNLTQASPAYSTKFVLEKVDLAKLKKDTGFKDKELTGLLNIKGELQGSMANFDTLKGSGYLTVKEGKIWEINLFKGLGELLFLPIYQRIVFSEIDADFFIQDKKVTFANSFLGGKMMELATNGFIGFDGAVDLDMHAKVSKSLLEDSVDLRKFGSMIFGNLLNIKISGTLQKPQYKVLPIPKALLKEIKRFFLKR
jgi:uncharacterized protein involved in outer membrane biogenesis